MIGWQDPSSLAELLKTAAVAVLPSREESFGNTMAESMAACVPVVSTRVGSIPEVVVHEETGLLVPPDDADALVHAILRCLQNPEEARAFAVEGHERARMRFTWDSSTRRFEELFRDLLSVR
jgi:glycosyltransferase involved in cell wall biosynthesis